MIKTSQLTEIFENKLNSLVRIRGISFKIWADVGVYTPPRRSFNTVEYVIDGILTTNASSLEATTLVMGVNNLELTFAIPLEPPRTTFQQTEEELVAIQDGQFSFPAYVTGVLTNYFQTPQTYAINDSDGKKFAVGILGGVAIPGDIESRPNIGKSITASVYLNVNVVEDGIVSTDITVAMDGVVMPALSKTCSRSSVLNSDVISNNLTSKNLGTSSALVVQVTFPATMGAPTKDTLKTLLDGSINRAHFVTVVYGGAVTKEYFMIISKSNSAAEGVTIGGITVEFVEVLQYADALEVPEGFQVGAFTLAGSDVKSLTFVSDRAVKAFIGGEVVNLVAGKNTVALTSDDFIDGNSGYVVYMITQTGVNVTPGDGVGFSVVKGVQNA